MKFHTIEDIFVANESAIERFEAELAGISAEQSSFRPTDESWSIAEITEHVNTVNGGFLRITHKLLKGAEAEGCPARDDLDLGPTSLDENGNQPPKFMAPEQVHPKGSVEVAEALSGLRQTLAGFREIGSRLAAVDLTGQTFPHPAFGPINAYQWMILLGEHTDRHRNQIESIKASPGFPS